MLRRQRRRSPSARPHRSPRHRQPRARRSWITSTSPRRRPGTQPLQAAPASEPAIAKASPKRVAVKAPASPAPAHAAAKPVAISKTEALPPPADTKAPPAKAKSGGDESFDALLKEAGVNESKKDVKPVLEK